MRQILIFITLKGSRKVCMCESTTSCMYAWPCRSVNMYACATSIHAHQGAYLLCIKKAHIISNHEKGDTVEVIKDSKFYSIPKTPKDGVNPKGM